MAPLFYALATLRDRLGDKERGATAIEYGLLAGLIALAIVIGATALGGGINAMFSSIASYLGGISIP